MTVADLRSDTLTQPCAAMRSAMAGAEVGDDVYGEDPNVCRLERRVAELLGKPAAVFVPSGTMANQIALWLHCRPGDEVVVAQGTHCMMDEVGASAALAGVQFSVARGEGCFGPEALEAAIGVQDDHAPHTSLLVVENTHNRAGGIVWPHELWRKVATLARDRGLAVHLDGARLWNASCASGVSMAELAQPADTVSVCFSKGLGAPVGSALVGDSSSIARARRRRKMLGGGMRQAGILAAAALHALEHHLPDLERDHAHARRLYDALAQVVPELRPPQSNILYVPLGGAVDASSLVQRASELGVHCLAMSTNALRLVTHRDLSSDAVDHAAKVLRDVIAQSEAANGR